MAVKQTISQGDDIATPLEAVAEHAVLMEMPETLKAGTAAMRSAGIKYLPMEDGESITSYNARVNRSVLHNAYWSTVNRLASDVFTDDLNVSEEIDERIVELLGNIDLRDTAISQFMQKVFRAAIHNGMTHVMVEYPKVNGKTVSDHKKAGARPYWVHIKPESIVGWRFEDRNGRPALTQLRVKEEIEVPVGKYGVEKKEQIRLYEPGKWSVWEETQQGWTASLDEQGNPLEGNTSLDFIPLVTLMLGEEMTEMTADPCLMDLAYMNVTHWQSSSDQRNILHYARMINFFGKMLDLDPDTNKVIFGANRLTHSTSPDSDLKVVEHSGKGIEAGRLDLKDLEAAMSLYGLSLLLPKTGNITATENAISKAENDSSLGGWIKLMDAAIATLVEFTGKYMGIEVEGAISANVDFKALLGGVDANILLEAFKSGLLPRQVVVEELKARGVITQEIDLVDLLAMIEEDRRADSVVTASGTFGAQDQSGQSQGQPPPEKE